MMKKLLLLALFAVACEATAEDAQCVRERAAIRSVLAVIDDFGLRVESVAVRASRFVDIRLAGVGVVEPFGDLQFRSRGDVRKK